MEKLRLWESECYTRYMQVVPRKGQSQNWPLDFSAQSSPPLEMTTLLSFQFDLDLNYLMVSLDPDTLYNFFPLQRENRIGKTHPAPFLCPEALE